MNKNMSIIAVANQKGGVGKTTTVINIAAALGSRGKRVLVIDLDPQANTTTGCGVDKHKLNASVYGVLVNNENISSSIMRIEKCGFDLLSSNRDLAGAEIELIDIDRREFQLREHLTTIDLEYDIVLLDCPPALSLLTLNGLVAANYILVPLQCEYYALEGLTDLLYTVNRLQANINKDIKLLGILRTMFDKRNNLANQVSQQLFQHFPTKVFKTYIPRNVRLAEAPSFGVPCVTLDCEASGSKAYIELTKEIIKRL